MNNHDRVRYGLEVYCNACGETKPESEFYSSRIWAQRAHCKHCFKIQVSNREIASNARRHPERYRECADHKCTFDYSKRLRHCPRCGKENPAQAPTPYGWPPLPPSSRYLQEVSR